MAEPSSFTPNEAARRISASAEVIRNLLRAGAVPGAVRIGRSWAITDQGIEELRRLRPGGSDAQS